MKTDGKKLNVILGIFISSIILIFILVCLILYNIFSSIEFNDEIRIYILFLIPLLIGIAIIFLFFLYYIHKFYIITIKELENTNDRLNSEIRKSLQLKREISENQTRLEIALESGEAESWEMDLITGNIFYTESWIKKTGNEINKKSINDASTALIIHPNDIDRKNSALQSYLNGETKYYETEFRIKTANGEWKWVLSRGKTVDWDANCKPTRLMGINTDITELKLAEEKIIESEQWFRRTFDQSPIGAAIISLDFYFLRANEVFCKIMDYTEEELKKLRFIDITHPDDSIKDIEEIEKLKKGEIDQYNTIKRYLKKDGSIIWGEVSVRVVRDIEDKPVCFLPMVQDITQLKFHEERLFEERNLLRTIVDNLPIALYIKDSKARKIIANPMDIIYIGRKEEEVIGKTDKEFFSEEIANQTYKDDLEVLKTGLPVFNREEKITNAKGRTFWLLTSKIPRINKEGKVIGIIGMGLDITERKSAEEELIKEKIKAEESDRLKSAFLANMSHEIRTPMNAILGFSELLIRPGITEERKIKYTKLIHERGLDLLRIIEDILDISKIEIGQMKLIESEVQVYNLLKELFEYYSLKKKFIKPDVDLNLTFTVENTIKNLTIYADGQRLKQILTNFIDNAFKFTFEGSIEIGCKMSVDGELIFYVSDTGIGIPTEKQQIVFDRFRQAEDSHTTRQFGGTGLGLSIAKGLSDLMGGRIWLESTVDKGTSFYFSMFPKNQVPKVMDPIEIVNIEQFVWKDKKILVVEDNDANSELLKEILDSTQANLIFARNGKDALHLFNTSKDFNLVLLDIRLPDMNGLNVAQEMKKVKKEIPIIAQTAYASQDELNECILAGCDKAISKPIQADLLMDIVAHFFMPKNS